MGYLTSNQLGEDFIEVVFGESAVMLEDISERCGVRQDIVIVATLVCL